jgi:diguanylate cyclase (GGDEF)-like protein
MARVNREQSRRSPLRRLARLAAVPAEERPLAGLTGGVVYILGGLTLAFLTVLPGVTHAHATVLLAVAGAAGLWGVGSILAIDWNKAPWWLVHLSTTTALGVIAVAVACSGGAVSPAWVYLFLVVVFASYFYPPAVAAGFLLGCVLIHALPLFYDARALHHNFLPQLVIAAPSYLVLGGAIIAGKRLMWTLRRRSEELAAEQGALRRVATAVVGGEPSERFYELVAREAGRLLGGGAAGILRLENPEEAIVLGSWADGPGGRYEPGTRIPVRPGSDLARALTTRRPVRIDDHSPGSPVDRLGYSSSVVAPIHVADRTWGALAVTAAEPAALTAGDERRLTEFGDLLTAAISSIEDRAKLAAQASTDPLTGLANHRTLQERLAAELSRAERHDAPLSVAVIDVDHFKQINDIGGHKTGDEMLIRVAECLRKAARAEDTLARAGGDEFAWVLPHTTREQALAAVERARHAIAASVPRPYRMSVSAGICDTTVTNDPTQLIQFADGALYWSKAHGRNQVWIYDPEVVAELSAHERAERLERSRALVGLRALARVIDAKDPAMSEHSERVSELAAKLARRAGWSVERAMLLSEAALVHDVGKIGVPDDILRKAGPLTPAEREHLKDHPVLAARIVEDVLTAEQVEWIRSQHERPDGRGYPRGLRAREISEGAALLSLADAWDVMTASRPGGKPKIVEEALSECIGQSAIQFGEVAVTALKLLHGAGELGGAGDEDEALLAPSR